MKVKVISNIMLNDKFGRCELQSDKIIDNVKAGQFFMISCNDHNNSTDPLLNRPFAISDIVTPYSFSFIYMIVGRGTRILSTLKTNDEVNIIYPLGNYFKPTKNKTIAVVAGGIGIAPMILLGKNLKQYECNSTIYYGGRKDSDILLLEQLKTIYDNVIIATEDGSLGKKGFITKPLEENIKQYDKLFACGPNMMLEAVNMLAVENNIPLIVSVDEQMGCGVGACLGCLIPIINSDSKRCCVEGPVFNAKDIDWNKLCKH